jgi:hypothetical protein
MDDEDDDEAIIRDHSGSKGDKGYAHFFPTGILARNLLTFIAACAPTPSTSLTPPTTALPASTSPATMPSPTNPSRRWP